jgi:hypothetical protein
MSPQMRERYGLTRRPWGAMALSGLLAVAFVVALAYAGYQILSPQLYPKLLAWNVVADDRVDVTFEVRRPDTVDVYCVLRAQDETRADVGYAVVPLARGTTYVQQTYPLRTLAPAYVVEVLACEAGGPPQRVIPPQFPPGVVPPEQPWTPSAG